MDFELAIYPRACLLSAELWSFSDSFSIRFMQLSRVLDEITAQFEVSFSTRKSMSTSMDRLPQFTICKRTPREFWIEFFDSDVIASPDEEQNNRSRCTIDTFTCIHAFVIVIKYTAGAGSPLLLVYHAWIRIQTARVHVAENTFSRKHGTLATSLARRAGQIRCVTIGGNHKSII